MLSEILDALATWGEETVRVVGLPGIVLLAFLENLFPGTPSEFLYPLAGKLAYDGKLVVWRIIVAGVAGSLAGSLLYYYLGYRLGEVRARNAIARFGQFRLLGVQFTIVSVADYDRAVDVFRRRGGSIVLVARLMPLVHSVISIPAGVTQMGLRAFIFYTALGSALWIGPLTVLGWWLGSNWERVLYWMDVYEYAWYAVMGLGLMIYIVRRRRSRWRSDGAHHAE